MLIRTFCSIIGAGGIKMNEKKDEKKTLPFANEITIMKEEVKKKIDAMSPEEFLNIVGFLMMDSDTLEDDFSEYEEFEDEDPFENIPVKSNIRKFPIRNDADLPF